MKTLFLLGTIAWAQSLQAPQVGLMIDSEGHARPVFGVAASVTVAAPTASGVLTSACANGFCVLKTAVSIFAGGVESTAPGPAMVVIDGASALIYFPESRRLVRWQAGSLGPVPFDVDGEIVGLRSVAGAMQFAVRRGGVTWIEDSSENALDSLPAPSGPVLLLPNAAIYTDGEQIVLRRFDGSELRFDAPGAQSMLAMEANYVEVRAGKVSYALRVDPGHERIFELPEPTQ